MFLSVVLWKNMRNSVSAESQEAEVLEYEKWAWNTEVP